MLPPRRQITRAGPHSAPPRGLSSSSWLVGGGPSPFRFSPRTPPGGARFRFCVLPLPSPEAEARPRRRAACGARGGAPRAPRPERRAGAGGPRHSPQKVASNSPLVHGFDVAERRTLVLASHCCATNSCVFHLPRSLSTNKSAICRNVQQPVEKLQSLAQQKLSAAVSEWLVPNLQFSRH